MKSLKILGYTTFVVGIVLSLYQLCSQLTIVSFEEDTNIHICLGSNCNLIGMSGILSSREDLYRYLSNLETIHQNPAIDINIDSFDFDQFDYVIIPGRLLKKLTRLIADECSEYDRSGLIPVMGTFEADNKNQVHVYKILSKNKYRWVCD